MERQIAEKSLYSVHQACWSSLSARPSTSSLGTQIGASRSPHSPSLVVEIYLRDGGGGFGGPLFPAILSGLKACHLQPCSQSFCLAFLIASISHADSHQDIWPPIKSNLYMSLTKTSSFLKAQRQRERNTEFEQRLLALVG